MSGWGWAAVIVIGWVVVGCVVAPLVGRWLGAISADYPEPTPPGHPGYREPPRGPCVEPPVRHRGAP